jgi:hypothetical protein
MWIVLISCKSKNEKTIEVSTWTTSTSSIDTSPVSTGDTIQMDTVNKSDSAQISSWTVSSSSTWEITWSWTISSASWSTKIEWNNTTVEVVKNETKTTSNTQKQATFDKLKAKWEKERGVPLTKQEELDIKQNPWYVPAGKPVLP